MDIEQEIEALLDEASDLPTGDYKLEMLNKAVRLATMHQLEDLEYEAKAQYSEEAISVGRSERILMHIPWLINYLERNPHMGSMDHVLWLYEWAIVTLADISRIEKDKILGALEDWESKAKVAGKDRSTILENRRMCHIALGDMEAAQTTHDELETYLLTHGSISKKNKVAVAYGAGFFLEKANRNAEAAERLAPLMENRSNDGFYLLARTLMLVPLAYLGKLELAAEYCRKTLKNIDYSPYYVPCHGDIMSFMALTGNWEKGIREFEQSVVASEENKLETELLTYYRGAILLFNSVPDHLQADFPLFLPQNHPFGAKNRRVNLNELRDHYRQRRDAILTAFDQRNGNHYISEYYLRWEGWTSQIPTYSLS